MQFSKLEFTFFYVFVHLFGEATFCMIINVYDTNVILLIIKNINWLKA